MRFNISRPDNYRDRTNGEKRTRWLKLGTAVLITAKDGNQRLLITLNHIPGTVVGFFDETGETQRESVLTEDLEPDWET